MARPKQTVVAPKWSKEACSTKSNNEEEHGASSEHQQKMESKMCKPKICLSSDTEIAGEADDHGPLKEVKATKKQYSNPGVRSIYCTACGKEMFSMSEIHEHPTLLGVGICSVCYDFLCSGPFTKDKIDGFEEQCRWCGHGGTVVMCDHCEKVFCEMCIVRNFGGRDGLLPILDESSDWRCFCCNPEALCVRINELKEFRNETRASSCADHASDVNPESRAASSIADRIMARSKQKERRNQNNGIRITSRNKNSRENLSKPSRKRAGSTLDREQNSRETVKQQKSIKFKQKAPSATTPVKASIRQAHQEVDASDGKGKETEFINSESHANEDTDSEFCAFGKTPRNNLLATFTEVSRDCDSEPENNSAAHCVRTKMAKLLKETFEGLKNLNKLMDRHTARFT